MLKALGDETRYAMYRELATSTRPLSAQDLADRLGLHANTVRLHLDRLRDRRNRHGNRRLLCRRHRLCRVRVL